MYLGLAHIIEGAYGFSKYGISFSIIDYRHVTQVDNIFEYMDTFGIL